MATSWRRKTNRIIKYQQRLKYALRACGGTCVLSSLSGKLELCLQVHGEQRREIMSPVYGEELTHLSFWQLFGTLSVDLARQPVLAFLGWFRIVPLKLSCACESPENLRRNVDSGSVCLWGHLRVCISTNSRGKPMLRILRPHFEVQEPGTYHHR